MLLAPAGVNVYNGPTWPGDPGPYFWRPFMFSIMLFIFLCFFGILAVLVYMLRCQEKLVRQLREEHDQLRVMLRTMEARLDFPDGRQPSAADVNVADVSVNDASEQQDYAAPAFSTETALDMDSNPHETARHQTRAARLTARAADPVATADNDPLLHLSFDPPAGKGHTPHTAGASVVDPALDLHFDPMDGAQGAARR